YDGHGYTPHLHSFLHDALPIYPARPGTHLRLDRRQHLSRRPSTGTAVLYAAGSRLVAISDANRRAISLRGRRLASDIATNLEPADRQSTRLNSSDRSISYALSC